MTSICTALNNRICSARDSICNTLDHAVIFLRNSVVDAHSKLIEAEYNRRRTISAAEFDRVLTIAATIVQIVLTAMFPRPWALVGLLPGLYVNYEAVVVATNKIKCHEKPLQRLFTSLSTQYYFDQYYKGAPLYRAYARIFGTF